MTGDVRTGFRRVLTGAALAALVALAVPSLSAAQESKPEGGWADEVKRSLDKPSQSPQGGAGGGGAPPQGGEAGKPAGGQQGPPGGNKPQART
jgi:hypothetical protein